MKHFSWHTLIQQIFLNNKNNLKEYLNSQIKKDKFFIELIYLSNNILLDSYHTKISHMVIIQYHIHI